MLKKLIQQINTAMSREEQVDKYLELNDYLSFYNDEDISCEYLPTDANEEKIKVELHDNPNFIVKLSYNSDYHIIKNIIGVNIEIIKGDVL